MIEGLALQRPRISAATIHRRVIELATTQNWPVPSYATVAAIVRDLDPALVCLAHEGPSVYRDRFDLIHRREADAPNAIWQADHTQLDVWVSDEQDHPAKPWLTIILDDYSRAVAGYRVSVDPPAARWTALALRDAIAPKTDPHWHVCGIPAHFYTDHGSDFTSNYLQTVAADLSMTLIFSNVGQPRGRGRIERFFQTVTQLFLSRQPGFAPPGSPSITPKLTIPELDRRFHQFIVKTYHHRVNAETGMEPQARWEADGFLPRLPESAEQLDLLLLTVPTTRKVHHDGIRFQALRYLDPALAAYIGESVVIRYDPRDLAEIRVFADSQFVCRAICPELAGTTMGLPEIVRARNERRRALQRGITDRTRFVEAYLAVHDDEDPHTEPTESSTRTPPLRRYVND